MEASKLTDNLSDIQGIIIRGYGDMKAACFILLSIEDAGATRRWLSGLIDVGSLSNGQNKPSDACVNIAFTYGGLQHLNLKPKILEQFSREFQEGMTGADHRRRILGDHSESDPEKWDWGGPTNKPVHILLMFYARDEPKLAEFYASQAKDFAANGLKVQQKLETMPLREDGKGHFGFRDGISQPLIPGLKKTGPWANTVAAGEFVLGYANEYGLFTERPLIDAGEDKDHLLPADLSGSNKRDFGRNGSYLVFRQLQQHVREFWQFLDKATQNPDSSSNPEARTRLASKMVGRWPSGAPLTLAPDKDNPNLGSANEFGYHHHDAYGLNCPLGAHVRRTNPRDILDPKPGSRASIEIGKRHRIIRRGRSYGPPVAKSLEPDEILNQEGPEAERGLHFICLNANISRQFEFIQHTWSNNQKFAGLYDDADPIIGDHDPGKLGVFTEQSTPIRKRLTHVPRFVTVRGGAYFFLPGLRAIRYLAAT